jgi:alpha-N-arabinofuranosidase
VDVSQLSLLQQITRNHPCPEGVTSATREEFLRNAVEWVRYANVKKKYGVKYWMIGNECWHNNVTKYYSVQDYISDIRTFSDSMKKVDPTIQIIANTNFKAFTKALLQGASDKVDMLCISNYPSYGLTNYQDWASGKFDMAAPFKEIAEYVREYAPDKKKNMKIIVAEYGAFDFSNSGWGSNNDMGHAMCDFDILGNLILQNQIPINCFWTTRWTYNSDKSGFNALNDNNQLLPAGYALQFWAQHLFPEIIEASSSSSQLKVYSSCNKTKDAYVYIMNKGEKEVQIKLRNRNEDIKDAACVACMYGTSAEDFFPTVNLNVTQVKDMAILPPYSINVYKVKIP